MPKIGRNDPCPCGSGKKYKRCCLNKDQAAAHATLAAKQAEMDARQKEHSARMQDYRESMQEAQELDNASNAVIDLVKTGKLEEAERAARELLVRYPEVHDGHNRLGMVYEARGQNREAADCYRRVIDFIHAHPEDHDPEMEVHYLELIGKLDPPAGSS
jgi:tetratricopeptide (TPR) repeat protein